jgi:hypothetical protein
MIVSCAVAEHGHKSLNGQLILSDGRLLYPPFEAKTPLKCHC